MYCRILAFFLSLGVLVLASTPTRAQQFCPPGMMFQKDSVYPLGDCVCPVGYTRNFGLTSGVTSMGTCLRSAASSAAIVLPSAFTPTSIPDLMTWLDASDPYNNGGKNLTPNEANAPLVNSWSDRSPRGLNAQVPTGATALTNYASRYSPFIGYAGLGGGQYFKTMGYFVGLKGGMPLTIPTGYRTNNFTAFLVVSPRALPCGNPNSQGCHFPLLARGDLASSGGFFYLGLFMNRSYSDADRLNGTAVNYQLSYKNTGTLTTSVATLPASLGTGKNNPVLLSFVKNGTNDSILRNATSFLTNTNGSVANLNSTDPWRIGGTYEIPKESTDPLGFQLVGSMNIYGLSTQIREVIFYNRALSVSERQNVENYLMTKWAL